MVPFLLSKETCFVSLWLCTALMTLGGLGDRSIKEAAEVENSGAKSHFLEESPPHSEALGPPKSIFIACIFAGQWGL